MSEVVWNGNIEELMSVYFIKESYDNNLIFFGKDEVVIFSKDEIQYKRGFKCVSIGDSIFLNEYGALDFKTNIQ